MTLNTGAFRSEENGLLSLPISTDFPPRKFFLTLNWGERPRTENPTKLSQILEPDASPKYYISGVACKGILTRAARRGKELPAALLEALEDQKNYRFRSEPVNRGGQGNTPAAGADRSPVNPQ